MTEQETGEVLQPLFGGFPTLRKFYSDSQATLRLAWSKALADVERRDAEVVIGKLVAGDIEMPANYEYDRMAIVIKREANAIRSARNERRRVTTKYLNSQSKAFAFITKDKTGHIAVELGAMVKRNEISREDNDVMMRDLMAWDKGGSKPEWMDSLFAV